jgi:hypothetical protein
MSKRALAGLIIATVIGVAGPVIGAQCQGPEVERSARVGEIAGQFLVPEQFFGGKNIRTAIQACDFQDGAQHFVMELRVYWNGVLMSWNEYEVAGELEADWSGEDIQFRPTWANDKVQNLLFWDKIVGRTIQIAGGAFFN